jgi:hypothetical protein
VLGPKMYRVPRFFPILTKISAQKLATSNDLRLCTPAWHFVDFLRLASLDNWIIYRSSPPACRISTMRFWVKNVFFKLKKIRKMLLVEAPGFEPGASCAQASRVISFKPFLCTTISGNKRLGEKFACGMKCENVARHAQGPSNFRHSQVAAKVPRLVPRIKRRCST